MFLYCLGVYGKIETFFTADALGSTCGYAHRGLFHSLARSPFLRGRQERERDFTAENLGLLALRLRVSVSPLLGEPREFITGSGK